jgi:hypothetical protein
MKTVTNVIHPTFGLFALACFTLSLTAHAATPQVDRGYPNGEITDADNVILELNTGVAKTEEPNPNHPKRRIDFTTNVLQCAPEQVEIRAELHLHFKKEGEVVKPESANFTEFTGTGKSTGRKYVASHVNVEKRRSARFQNGAGSGEFILEFRVIGNPNPPPKPDPNPNKPFRFTVSYKIVYTFANKVKGLNLGSPKACCNPDGCLD